MSARHTSSIGGITERKNERKRATFVVRRGERSGTEFAGRGETVVLGIYSRFFNTVGVLNALSW